MYLFFFAALWIVFQYANEKNIFESQQSRIESLEARLSKAQDSILALNDKLLDSRYFKLEGNEKAYDYFDRFEVDPVNLESRLKTAIISKNSSEGNPLIPYENATGIFQINKVEVLNHKWIIADFSDGQRWGELLLSYDVDENGEISFEMIRSIIYP